MYLTVSPITYVLSHSKSLLGDIYLLHPHAINKVTKQRNLYCEKLPSAIDIV